MWRQFGLYLEHKTMRADNGEDFTILAPVVTTDFILSHAQWQDLAEQVEEFYGEVSPSEITRANEEIIKRSFDSFRRVDQLVISGQECDGFVYVMECKGLRKIGRTNNVQRRYRNIQTDNPFPVRLEMWCETPSSVELEKSLHGIFGDKRVKGEWFDLTDKDIEALTNLLVRPGRQQ